MLVPTSLISRNQRGVFEQYTYYSEAQGGLGKYGVVTKGHHIGNAAPPPLEFTANVPLTQFVKTILQLMRHWEERELATQNAADTTALISDAAALHFRSLGPKQPQVLPTPTEEEMRDDMEDLFRFMLSMAWPTDDKAKLHTVRKPTGATGQAPAEGTASSGSKKRKRTVQDEPESDTEGHKSKKAGKSIPQPLGGGPEERKTRRLLTG